MNANKHLPRTAPVSSEEFQAWRTDPAAAYRSRHSLPATRTSSTPALRALEDRQTVNHYAAAYLREDANVEALFGRPGRVRFLKYYLVPQRWSVRADAVFLPRDGSEASVLLIRAATPFRDAEGTFVPETDDLFELAYQRFTMRQAKRPAERCLLLLLNPGHRNDLEAPALGEMFECHDVTRFIDAPAGPGTPSIAAVVAEEAVLAADFLQADYVNVLPLERASDIPAATPEHLSPEGREAIGRILGRVTERD